MKFFVLLLLILSFSACSVYTPTATPIIYTEKKGDKQINAGLEYFSGSPLIFSSAVFYSPVNHLAIGSKIKLRTDLTYQLELNTGYIYTLKNFQIGLLGLISKGDFKESSLIWNDHLQGEYSNFGGLFQVGYKTELFDLFFSNKFSRVNWEFNKSISMNPRYSYDYNFSGFAVEPATTGVIKPFEKIKVAIDYTYGFYNKSNYRRIGNKFNYLYDEDFIPVRSWGQIGVSVIFLFPKN